jgi:hypothetical protein
MKHSILSTYLLIGFGLTTGMSFLGGGDVHYAPEMANNEIQRSGDPDETGAKEDDADIAMWPETTQNQETGRYASATGNTDADRNTKLAQ